MDVDDWDSDKLLQLLVVIHLLPGVGHNSLHNIHWTTQHDADQCFVTYFGTESNVVGLCCICELCQRIRLGKRHHRFKKTFQSTAHLLINNGEVHGSLMN